MTHSRIFAMMDICTLSCWPLPVCVVAGMMEELTVKFYLILIDFT